MRCSKARCAACRPGREPQRTARSRRRRFKIDGNLLKGPMSRIAYVNGRYRPHRAAMVHIEDRGYQFADGVYEVCEVRGGRIVDERRHMVRLKRSLGELRIDLPMPLPALSVVLHETVRRNRVRDGIVYLQVTRGTARRDHAFPPPGTPPSVVVTARIARCPRGRRRSRRKGSRSSRSPIPAGRGPTSSRYRSCPTSWPSRRRGTAAPAKPGSSIPRASSPRAPRRMPGSSQAEEVVTRPADNTILSGISRAVVLDAIAAQGLRLRERPFTVAEAKAAREAFVTAASQIVLPVVRIDGSAVGDGRPGPVATALRRQFHRHVEFT